MTKPVKVVLGGVVALCLLAAGAVGIWLWATYNKAPLPIDDRCSATVNGTTASLDPEQAYNAALISGVSIKRGLPARAASIALTTAYQESGIRNLDYGHSDSLGLFQQRPSKGWGTAAQIMDPWYSATAFYKELVKVKNWQTGDINDIAQAVQRSAYPEAYRRHVTNARTLASSLTGETPASFSCVVRTPEGPDRGAMKSFLTKNLGATVSFATPDDTTLVVTARTSAVAWAAAHQAIAATAKYGLAQITLGDYSWTHNPALLASWRGVGSTDATKVVLTFAAK
ncbi:MAG: hypothetical protein IPO80_14150 [Propionibacteriaceae bacterium]|nr:hypothetical protein [Propionibacteriaceae bacterium]